MSIKSPDRPTIGSPVFGDGMAVPENTAHECGSGFLVINPSRAAIYIELPSPLKAKVPPTANIGTTVARYLPELKR